MLSFCVFSTLPPCVVPYFLGVVYILLSLSVYPPPLHSLVSVCYIHILYHSSMTIHLYVLVRISLQLSVHRPSCNTLCQLHVALNCMYHSTACITQPHNTQSLSLSCLQHSTALSAYLHRCRGSNVHPHTRIPICIPTVLSTSIYISICTSVHASAFVIHSHLVLPKLIQTVGSACLCALSRAPDSFV
jgi:hypothetical protein